MAIEPDDFYSKGAEEFAENHKLNDRPNVEQKLDKFCEKLQGKRVLDAGCGSVEEPDKFVEKGFDYVGVDIAPGMVEYARENRKGDFYVMDIRDLEFSDNKFHGVWCNASIFFVPNKGMEEIAMELARVIKQEGILYINFKLGSGSFLKQKYGEQIRQYLVSEEQAREILGSAGFEITDFSKVEIPGTTLGEFFCRLQS
jgi:2-polyprenyl-3-methyl-5-hydroxy-6-metoxy-1,4-benzoquinol methylase